MAISTHERVGKPLGLFAECLCSSVDGWGAEVRDAFYRRGRRVTRRGRGHGNGDYPVPIALRSSAPSAVK